MGRPRSGHVAVSPVAQGWGSTRHRSAAELSVVIGSLAIRDVRLAVRLIDARLSGSPVARWHRWGFPQASLEDWLHHEEQVVGDRSAVPNLRYQRQVALEEALVLSEQLLS